MDAGLNTLAAAFQAVGHRQILIKDKRCFGAGFENTVDASGIELPGPVRVTHGQKVMVAPILPNDQIGATIRRSRTACDR